jgi:AraC-like DNA-binding protein
MKRQPETTKIVETKNDGTFSIDLSPEVVTSILKKLEKFESTKKYLDKEMNLYKLASLLNTNTKYVSKIILKYREKGTIEYISDLKIDHIIELLKNENKYRNYTNKALKDEAGFGSTQNFTRAFNTHTGISPTYFIKELNKSILI